MKRNLRVYERSHVYPQSISYYTELIKLFPRKHPYLVNFWEVISYKGDSFRWARDTSFLENATRKWFKRWISSRRSRNEIMGWFERDHLSLKENIAPLRHKKIQKLDNIELFKLYRKIIDFALKHLKYSEYTVDLFDDYFAKLLNEYLLKNDKNINPLDITDLISPATISAGLKYKKKILELSMVKEKNEAGINDMVDKYDWIKMAWDGTNELTAADVLSDIEAISKLNAGERKKEIRSIKNYDVKILNKRSKLIRKYKLNKNQIGTYFLLLDKFTVFHDYRKEMQLRCNQIIYRVLREISKRFNVSYRDIMFYKTGEIKTLLLDHKAVAKSVISNRQKGFMWLIVEGKITEYLGKDAIKKLNELVLEPLKNHSKDKELKGLPASRGRVKGIVFIAKSAKIANKYFEKSKILVASMTTVDYLPAMKKAAAVITDDGGATSHAAIVSREFGIPCIVGTKIATKVLKDGDMVEVDANNGIVKILK